MVSIRAPLAKMRISRGHRFALRDLWSDSLRHRVLAWRFSFGFKMESARVCRVLRADRLRSLRRDRGRGPAAPAANGGLDRRGKKRGANRGDQSARAELDLSPRAPRSLLANLDLLVAMERSDA